MSPVSKTATIVLVVGPVSGIAGWAAGYLFGGTGNMGGLLATAIVGLTVSAVLTYMVVKA